MRKGILALLLLAVVAAAVYFGFSDETKGLLASLGNTQDEQVSSDPRLLKLVKAEVSSIYTDDYGIAHVCGQVSNSSGRTCELALVRITAYDKDDNMVKRLKVKVRDIPSVGTKTFDIAAGTFNTGFGADAVLLGVAF